jgi:hypothetical protein
MTKAAYDVMRDFQRGRFSDGAFAPQSRQPAKPEPPASGFSSHTCPFCDRRMHRSSRSILGTFSGGVYQLFAALLTIAFAFVRCIRFLLAAALCFVGFVGSCCAALGVRIAHADDRRLFARL